MIEFLLVVIALLLIAILTILVVVLKQTRLIHSDNCYWGINIDYDIRKAHPKAFQGDSKRPTTFEF